MSNRFYIGVKLQLATPMTLGAYNEHRGWTIPEDEDPEREGYLVKYQNDDEYQSWSPKEIFESAYLPLHAEDGSRICQADVERFMGDLTAEALPDGKTALVKCESATGFVQYEASSCVDPANFDLEMGKNIGGGKIADRFWGHLGFVLQWAKNGLSGPALAPTIPSWQDRVVQEKRDLDAKIQLLSDFSSGDRWDSVSADEQDALCEQITAMRDYSKVLAGRISRF